VWVTKDKCLLDEEEEDEDEEEDEEEDDEEDDEEDEVMSKFRHHKKPSITILIFNRMRLL